MSGLAAESPAHLRSQVDPPEHDTEHDPLQLTWQVELSPQETLPLLPTLMVQVAFFLQSMLPDSPVVSSQVLPLLHELLHEPAHEPMQLEPLSQVKLQLPPLGSQPVPFHWQPPALWHWQLEPEQAQPAPGQVTFGASAFAQPSIASSPTTTAVFVEGVIAFLPECSRAGQLDDPPIGHSATNRISLASSETERAGQGAPAVARCVVGQGSG